MVEKKSKVYVTKGDKVVKVMFGDPNMAIRKKQPRSKKIFLEQDTTVILQQTKPQQDIGLARHGR